MPQRANETQDTSLLLFSDLKKHAPGLIVQGPEQNAAEVALVSRLIFVQFLQENGHLGTKRENYLQNAAQMVLAKGQDLYEDFVKESLIKCIVVLFFRRKPPAKSVF